LAGAIKVADAPWSLETLRLRIAGGNGNAETGNCLGRERRCVVNIRHVKMFDIATHNGNRKLL
jgi:hypothetical protein